MTFSSRDIVARSCSRKALKSLARSRSTASCSRSSRTRRWPSKPLLCSDSSCLRRERTCSAASSAALLARSTSSCRLEVDPSDPLPVARPEASPRADLLASLPGELFAHADWPGGRSAAIVPGFCTSPPSTAHHISRPQARSRTGMGRRLGPDLCAAPSVRALAAGVGGQRAPLELVPWKRARLERRKGQRGS